jgi:hypothetical protein
MQLIEVLDTGESHLRQICSFRKSSANPQGLPIGSSLSFEVYESLSGTLDVLLYEW